MNNADIKNLKKAVKDHKKKGWEVQDRFDLKRKKKKIPKNPAKALLKHRRKKYQEDLKNKRKRVKK